MNNDVLLSSIMTDAEDAIRAIVKDTYICDFGIVKEVLGNGSVVAVEISVANSEEDLRVVTCVLANVSSGSACINIVPKVNDKVLVLYPRRYDSKMFGVDKEEAIINEYSDGYNSACGIAILMNQARSDYKNVVKIDEDKIEIKTLYNSDKEKNEVVLTVDKDNFKADYSYDNDSSKYANSLVVGSSGSMSLSMINATLSIDEEGLLSYTRTKQGKKSKCTFTDTSLSIADENGNKINTSNSGMTLEDKNGKKIVMSSGGTDINGILHIN
jgi:hypothetical protein